MALQTLQAQFFGNWEGVWKGAGILWSALHLKNALENLCTMQVKDDSAWLEGCVPGEADVEFRETALFWRVFLQRAMSKFPYAVLWVRQSYVWPSAWATSRRNCKYWKTGFSQKKIVPTFLLKGFSLGGKGAHFLPLWSGWVGRAVGAEVLSSAGQNCGRCEGGHDMVSASRSRLWWGRSVSGGEEAEHQFTQR